MSDLGTTKHKVAAHSDDWVAEPSIERPVTFKELVAEKHELEFKLRKIHEKTIRKCMDEGWYDCLKVDWTKVIVRSR